jgi:hypothetical protein
MREMRELAAGGDDAQRRFKVRAGADNLAPDGQCRGGRKIRIAEFAGDMFVHAPFAARADMAVFRPFAALQRSHFAHNADAFFQQRDQLRVDGIDARAVFFQQLFGAVAHASPCKAPTPWMQATLGSDPPAAL